MKPTFECVLCKRLSRLAKPEHVLLNALGGRLTSRHVLCSKCNEVMGSGPDKALAEALGPIRNMNGFLSGSGEPPPPISYSKDGNHYRISGDGAAQAKLRNPVAFKHADDGGVDVSITAASVEHAKRLLRQTADRLGTTASELAAQSMSYVSYHRPPRLEGVLELGSELTQRSMLKACLCLWALEVGNEELTHPAYDTIRNFARHGDRGSLSTALDSRKLALHGVNSYGQFFNMIGVWSDATGKAFGNFRILNSITWSFILRTDGAPASQSRVLIANPRDPRSWNGSLPETQLPSDGLVAPEAARFHPDELNANFALLSAAGREYQLNLFSHWLTKMSLQKAGAVAGEPITEELLSAALPYMGAFLEGAIHRKPIVFADDDVELGADGFS